MRKSIKKLIVSLCLVMAVMGSSMCCFAMDNDIEIRTTSQPFESGEQMLNCYTSGTPVSGTQISTWTRTGNDSQLWAWSEL